MPLAEGDIVVDSIISLTITSPQGLPVLGYQYRFMVRGHGPFYAEFPAKGFDVNFAHQEIIRQAADQVALLDRFALRG